ncbi:Hpt domain-containing protein [Granulicella rosea]|uniref:Hpt domain-containing protein n=1 Tax=Granulicella rosea TaxID=474952 RepID=A0A239CQT3_9BACT|nr:response regulator [Granulicella rosea]SNS22467.1 Hpt domain-containing protein [Granulicella rosea]
MTDSANTSPHRSLRLHLVDDDEVSRELLTLLLDAEGYQVVAFASGDELLAWLRRADSVAPDAILADLQMPGLTGNPLAEAIRAACRPAPLLLAMSGSQPAPEAVSAFDGFLLKPFAMDDLAAALASCAAEPSEAAARSGMVDLGTYNLLKKTMGEAQLGKLFEMCLSDAAKRIAIMRDAQAIDDAATYKAAAHAIKGGCGLVGATQLYAIANEMEIAGPDSTSLDALDRFVAASAQLQRMLVGQAG